jgi:hypothetical protein
MTFNEFQRELQKRGIKPAEAYMFTLVYERLIQVSREVEENAKVVLSVVESLQNVVQLSEVMQRRLSNIAKGILTNGVDIQSVANEPEN